MLCACQYSIMNNISKRRFTVLACAARKQPLFCPLLYFVSLLSLFYSHFFLLLSDLPIYPLLYNDPLILAFPVIWHFCWSHSLSRLTVLMLENTQLLTNIDTHTHIPGITECITSYQTGPDRTISWSEKSLPLVWIIQMNEDSFWWLWLCVIPLVGCQMHTELSCPLSSVFNDRRHIHSKKKTKIHLCDLLLFNFNSFPHSL